MIRMLLLSNDKYARVPTTNSTVNCSEMPRYKFVGFRLGVSYMSFDCRQGDDKPKKPNMLFIEYLGPYEDCIDPLVVRTCVSPSLIIEE